MFSSSALRVVESTSSRLVIVDPPNYLLGAILLIVGILIGGFLLKFKGQANLRLMLIVLVPLFIGAIGFVTSSTVVELSKASNNLTISRRRFGFTQSASVTPFSSLRFATVETSRGARRLALITNSGGVLHPSGAAARGGEYEAANAINDFLGVQAPR
jgi:hypothetical protein